MNNYCRTDLAAELITDKRSLPRGVSYREYVSECGAVVEKIRVFSEGAKSFGKPQGTYVTVHMGDICDIDDDMLGEISSLLGYEIRFFAEKLSKKKISSEFKVLAVGLGNVNMTPDAVGPMCMDSTDATASLLINHPDFFNELGCCSLYTLSPGTMGQTGIETSELILGVVGRINPDIVIAVDALAARSAERLGNTVQISDSGIHPGSGVGNRRKGINEEFLGVPVVAVGIPTVVDSSSIIKEALEQTGFEEFPEKLNDLLENRRNFFVAPKECDALVKKASELLAAALNFAFGIKHEGQS